VLAESGTDAGFKTLAANAPGFLPEFAGEFFEKFSRRLPSLEKVQDSAWTGGAPGLSGHYCFVWSRHPVKLRDEIYRLVASEIRRQTSKPKGLKPKPTNEQRHRSKRPA
jgi:phage terminase small subunit